MWCVAQGRLHFEVHWIAYQLQPLAPPEGVPKMEFLQQKFKGQAEYLMKKKGVSQSSTPKNHLYCNA